MEEITEEQFVNIKDGTIQLLKKNCSLFCKQTTYQLTDIVQKQLIGNNVIVYQQKNNQLKSYIIKQKYNNQNIYDNIKVKEQDNTDDAQIKLQAPNGSLYLKVTQVFNKPVLFNQIQFSDAIQGQLGDCYLISILCLLAFQYPEQIKQIVYRYQNGRYQTRFFQRGVSTYVNCNDFLYFNQDRKTLKYAQSNTDSVSGQTELWVPFIEKAYSMLYGSYKAIEGGIMDESLNDLCGGLSKYWFIDFSTKDEVFQQIQNLHDQNYVLSCGTSGSFDQSIGIYTGHAYSIMDIDIQQRNMKLRNPWGSGEFVSQVNNDGINDGIYTIDIDTFKKYFNVVITSKLVDNLYQYPYYWYVKNNQQMLQITVNSQKVQDCFISINLLQYQDRYFALYVNNVQYEVQQMRNTNCQFKLQQGTNVIQVIQYQNQMMQQEQINVVLYCQNTLAIQKYSNQRSTKQLQSKTNTIKQQLIEISQKNSIVKEEDVKIKFIIKK